MTQNAGANLQEFERSGTIGLEEIGFKAMRSSVLWRRYLLGWIVVAAVLFVDIVWLLLGGYSVGWPGIVLTAKALGLCAVGALILAGIGHIPRYREAARTLRCPEATETIAWMALFMCFISAACVLSYLCITVNTPLVDDALIRFDAALGFDWLALYHWVQSHGTVHRVLAFAYGSGQAQIILIPFILGMTRHSDELAEFVFLFMLSIILVCLVSTPFPATSAFVHFHVSDAKAIATVSDFPLLRNGSLRAFNVMATQGLVSMPSFHTAMAVLLTYVLRRMPVLLVPITILNTLMILSTPTQGGHYLADVLSGLILAFVTIYFFNLLNRHDSAIIRAERH